MSDLAPIIPESQMARQFGTGATRSDDTHKPNYRGYLSSLVIKRFGEYMYTHQYGGQRSADNWKKGIPLDSYMESIWRHFVDVWDAHDAGRPVNEESWCALLFNIQGYLHEVLKHKD